MATTNLNSKSLGKIYVQSGNGVPNHISIKGTLYTDIDTGLLYSNINNSTSWVNVSLISYGGVILSGNTTTTAINRSNWTTIDKLPWYESGVCNGVHKNSNSGGTLEISTGRGGRYEIDVSASITYSASAYKVLLGISINNATPNYYTSTYLTTSKYVSCPYYYETTLNDGDKVKIVLKSSGISQTVIVSSASIFLKKI